MPQERGYGADAGGGGAEAIGRGHSPEATHDAATRESPCASCDNIRVSLALAVRRLDQVLDWLQTIAYQQTTQTVERQDYIGGLKRVFGDGKPQ